MATVEEHATVLIDLLLFSRMILHPYDEVCLFTSYEIMHTVVAIHSLIRGSSAENDGSGQLMSLISGSFELYFWTAPHDSLQQVDAALHIGHTESFGA